jgi:hypothetical protein
MGIL